MENVRFEQFREEVGTEDIDFAGRTKFILFDYIIFSEIIYHYIKTVIYLPTPHQIASSLGPGMASYSL